VQGPSERAENIEVEASHFGIGLNPLAWYAIGDRLGQPEGEWQPFDRNGALRWLYRDPQRKGWFW
jgi:extradiol dioxygenase family protein